MNKTTENYLKLPNARRLGQRDEVCIEYIKQGGEKALQDELKFLKSGRTGGLK